MKVCNKCGVEKELEEFTIDKRIKSGKQGICRECCSKHGKKHRKENKELYSIKSKEKYQKLLNDPEKLKKRIDYEKKYKEKNKEKIKKRDKNYRKKNIEKIKKREKNYRKNNKDKHKKYRKENKEYFKNKKKEYYSSEKGKISKRKWYNNYNKKNPHVVAWRSLMRRVIIQLQYNKTDTTLNELGYSSNKLKLHISSLFLSGMSWNNYGEWHIDHIKSVSLFNKKHILL